MKRFLFVLICGSLLAGCQAASRSTRQTQPRKITSEVDTQAQRIAPSRV